MTLITNSRVSNSPIISTGEKEFRPFSLLSKTKEDVALAGPLLLLKQLNPTGPSTLANYTNSPSNKSLVALQTLNTVEVTADAVEVLLS